MSQRRHFAGGTAGGGYGAEDVNTISKGIAPENFMLEMSVEAARRQGELEMKLGNSAVRNEYQKRLADVAALRGKAQHVLQNLDLERNAMQRAKDELLQLLKDFESTLQVNLDWIKLRKGQTSQNSSVAMREHHDNINTSIEMSVKDIKAAIMTIATQIQKLQGAMFEADGAVARLKDDIIAKSGGMVLDRAAMEGLVVAVDETPPASPSGALAGSGRSGGLLSSPRTAAGATLSSSSTRGAVGAAAAPSVRSSSDWISKGQAATVHAQHVTERCTPVRKESQEIVKDVRESGRLQRNAAVLDALRSQAKCGEQLDNQMELNKKTLTMQVASFTKQIAASEVSLEKVREQIKLAQQRLKVSAVRPALDGAPSNVEEMLLMEVNKLTRNESELKGKLDGLTRHKERAEQMVAALDAQAAENRKTTVVAKQCLDVKLPPISSPRANPNMTPRRIR